MNPPGPLNPNGRPGCTRLICDTPGGWPSGVTMTPLTVLVGRYVSDKSTLAISWPAVTAIGAAIAWSVTPGYSTAASACDCGGGAGVSAVVGDAIIRCAHSSAAAVVAVPVSPCGCAAR